MKSKKRSNGQGSLTYEIRNGKKYYIAKVTVYDKYGDKKRKSFGSYSKKEVEEKLNTALYEINHGVFSLEGKTPLGEAFKEWLFAFKKEEVESSTFAKYETAYRLRLEPYQFTNTASDELKVINFKNHFNRLKKDGNSDNSIKLLLMLLKAFYRYVISEDIVFKSPVENISIKKDSKKAKTINVLDRNAQKSLENYILNNQNKVNLLILFDLYTGLRLGEILGLKEKDVKEGKITVHNQLKFDYTYDESGDRTRNKVLSELKTESSYRTIPLPLEAKKVLSKVYAMKAEEKLLAGPGYQDNQFIFSNPVGGPISHKMPTRHLEKICEELKIPRITFHGLRHTYATRLFEEDVPIKTVQALLGHSDIKTTLNIYVHNMDKTLQDSVSKLNNMVL